MEVYISTPANIDLDIYKLWLDGYSVDEATSSQIAKGVLKHIPFATRAIVRSDICDQYHLFDMLEPLLQNPPKLAEHQLMFPLSVSLQKVLVSRYYEFDADVIREILGKRLSGRNRKDLDDISEKTSLRLRSCRRQFDNMKRVFKTVEDMMGSLAQNIQTHYLLDDALAKNYAAIVFITNNRFETGKKKLQYLTFNDFVFCADEMITNWSYSSEDCKLNDMDVDFDRDFLMDLRELKVLLEKDILDDHKGLVCRKLKDVFLERVYNDMDSSFKGISKLLIGIASNLNHSKEARDIFLDLVEKLIEPMATAKWGGNDVQQFLHVYTVSVIQIDSMKRSYSHIFPIWERYMIPLRKCIVQMYHA